MFSFAVFLLCVFASIRRVGLTRVLCAALQLFNTAFASFVAQR
jgi:hypothetical protein